MSLFSALNIAVSGLNATQAGIDIVSQNIANADTPGYVRRRSNPVQLVAGERTVGVKAGQIDRLLDTVAQKQLRLETAGSGYTSLKAQYASDLDKAFGPPGGAGSLDTTFNNLTTSLQGLLNDPVSYSTRTDVLNKAQILTGQLSSISETIQAKRTETEGRLSASVDRVNSLLGSISQLNKQVVASSAGGGNAALLDQRDAAVQDLSKLLDIQTSPGPQDSINILTPAGLSLFDGSSPTKLVFDSRGALTPNSVYSADDSKRSVGTIKAVSAAGGTVDVIANKFIRSGEIAASLELRDDTLVKAQRQLDELAANLSRAVSDKPAFTQAANVAGRTGSDIDIAGLQAGNAITLDYTDPTATPPGAARRIKLIPVKGAQPSTITPDDVSDPTAIVKTIDISGSFANTVDSIGTALGSRFSVAASPGSLGRSQAVRILSDGTATQPNITKIGADITVTGLSDGTPQVPLFIDNGRGGAYTGSFENGSQLTGFAQRIVVNPALVADRSKLVVSGPSVPQGDTARPQFILDQLTKTTRTFPAATGVGGINAPYVATVGDFTRRIVETQGANAENAQILDEGQSVALSTIQSRYDQSSKVNIDEEMSQLLRLQTAYSANARVLVAVKDMFDALLRI